MAETKRSFLYDFNRTLREIYSCDSKLESVFENIDNGTLHISLNEIIDFDFLEKVNKLIFIVKRIIADPYKVLSGKQTIVPASEAKNSDQESFKLTLADSTLWNVKDGKIEPSFAYTLVKEDVEINYENAFIAELLKQLIIRLKMIRTDILRVSGASHNDSVDNNVESRFAEAYSIVTTQINKLNRISKQKIFVENSKRQIDSCDLFYTDTLKHDKRYNFCYKFFVNDLKFKKSNVAVTKDFRVLYHNFALIQILYKLYKSGYSFGDTTYQVAVSGKMIIDEFAISNESSCLKVSRAFNGVKILSDKKSVLVEFSKKVIHSQSGIVSDYNERCKKNNSDKIDYYVAYLTSKDCGSGIVSIGYNNAQVAIESLINAL